MGIGKRLGKALLGSEIERLRKQLGREVETLRTRLDEQAEQQRRSTVALGALLARQVAGRAESCNDAEFGLFSQFREDGILEFLIQRCAIAPERFVEIGVESYAEANTRFLAEHRQWAGLIVDLNPDLASDLARTQLNWRSQVRAVSSYVTRDNIREIVEPFAAGGLGLLSLDIDGVDYWVLERLVALEPALFVVEYNALFGDQARVAVPYAEDFDRRRPEFHNVYYGASLGAFEHLLGGAGYSLVACNTAGHNAFFVRSDRLGSVPARRLEEAFRPRRFVEHRAADGQLTGIADQDRQLADVQDLPLVDVTDGRPLRVADLG